jgi:anti-anti-sigma factor
MGTDAIHGEWIGSGVYAILIEGDFDLSLRDHAIALTEKALAEKPKALLVNVKRCTFLDSTAIAVILGARQRAMNEGFGFALVGHNPTVDRMIELTGLGEQIEVLRNHAEAFEALGLAA